LKALDLDLIAMLLKQLTLPKPGLVGHDNPYVYEE
jgi:hypothetical protein